MYEKNHHTCHLYHSTLSAVFRSSAQVERAPDETTIVAAEAQDAYSFEEDIVTYPLKPMAGRSGPQSE